MKFKENKFLIILFVITFLCLFFSTGHLSNILIDVGREMYYPKAILENKILYKDIFCIYGPLSYLLNAFIFKIFGAKLTSLYLMGWISSLSIVFFTYKISKKFLPEFHSFSITLFVIVTGCLSTRIFNFTLPYSYAVLYGLVCFLISVYFLIEYLSDKKNKNLYISSLFAGFAVSNKYDFILYLIVLFVFIFKTKNIKTILKSTLMLSSALFAPFLILFIQGLEIKNLFNAFDLIKKFTNTSALQTFYVTQGVYYTKRVWLEWLFEILEILIYIIPIYFGILLFDKKRKAIKTLGVLLILSGTYFAAINFRAESFLFLTFLTSVFLIVTFKKNTKVQNVFIISSLLISLKSLWALSYGNYGLYYIPCVLISFFILLQNNFGKKLSNAFCVLLIGFALGCALLNINNLLILKGKINTEKGNLYTVPSMAEAFNEVIDFLNQTKEENPKIAVFPEGLAVNFLIAKKNTAENFYNSLIPLYIEGFGEEALIDYYKNNMPSYVILSNIGAESYQKGEICKTYAWAFCNFIYENYTPQKTTSYKNPDSFIIFKIKKEKNNDL